MLPSPLPWKQEISLATLVRILSPSKFDLSVTTSSECAQIERTRSTIAQIFKLTCFDFLASQLNYSGSFVHLIRGKHFIYLRESTPIQVQEKPRRLITIFND